MVNKSKNMEVNEMTKPNIINGLDLTFSSSLEIFLEDTELIINVASLLENDFDIEADLGTGNLEIKSQNFHLTPEGDVSASNLHLGGVSFVKNVSVADYFAFRNIVITSRNYRKYMREFTATNNSATRIFWQLVLDGSLGGQQGMLVTLEIWVMVLRQHMIVFLMCIQSHLLYRQHNLIILIF